MVESTHCHSAAAPVQAAPDWLQPEWPAPAHVHALCTTRKGGASTGGFASMNLGGHVGDAPRAVADNRRRLQAALQAVTPVARPVFLEQVHGCSAVVLGTHTPNGLRADAAVSVVPGLACTVMVADCLPELITDRLGRMVAAAHAGWRGLAGGVLESVLEHFKPLAQAPYAQEAIQSIANGVAETPHGLMAWLGPCIGPQAFEVGEEVRSTFCANDAAAELHFAPQGGGKYLANLPALARQRLAAQGVAQVFGNDGSAAWCTFSESSRFFSHRRDGSVTGRMVACIWLD